MIVEMIVRLTPNEGDSPQEMTFEAAQELYAQLGSVLGKVPVVTPVDNSQPPANTFGNVFAGKPLSLHVPQMTAQPLPPTEASPSE